MPVAGGEKVTMCCGESSAIIGVRRMVDTRIDGGLLTCRLAAVLDVNGVICRKEMELMMALSLLL